MKNILNKYAQLLVKYCLELQPKEKLLIRTTILAEPLVKEVYREAIRAGAIVETMLDFSEQGRILLTEGQEHQLQHVPTVFEKAINDFDAYLFIRAPFNLREQQNVPASNTAIRGKAFAEINQRYFARTATRDLKRNLCQFPTQANAQEAGLSLEEYQNFVFGACKLFDENPIQSWLQVRKDQQAAVDLLNSREFVQYKGDGVDISFSTKGRIWMNSDGQTNMPSGEVYTSPVEDSVNGVVHFSYPAIYQGHEVEGVTLWVKDGYVEKWEAKRGYDFLTQTLETEGARRFGEAAIGTNYDINRFTKNILFDEKIGGTIHMALGQSYLQTGGKNKSSVHWDMIAGMQQGGEIWADGEKIYQDGRFIF